MSSIKGISHLSKRSKRRLYCKLQLWMWRKQREKYFWNLIGGRKLVPIWRTRSCLNIKAQSLKSKRKVPEQSQIKTATPDPDPKCASKTTHFSQTSYPPGTIIQTTSMEPESVAEFEFAVPSKITLTGLDCHLKKQRNCGCCQKLVDDQSTQCTAALQELLPNADTKIFSKSKIPPQNEVGLTELTDSIHEFLHDFFTMYGTFIPLQKRDVLRHLKRMFNTDFNDRRKSIYEVVKCKISQMWKPIPSFRVVFKKHTLTLDDLTTLAYQNWLNDQVINMYGELIMEAAQHKVHFFNSFFHRQLMTKGYCGVKRWTKKVDLFSKTLLLVPIHLEVHWCLVATDVVRKKICLFDSQGNEPLDVVQNILNYLIVEAREKRRTSFINGWNMSLEENVPQQTNENDCGVFVLEYSRCLALAQPLHFSQKNIPGIRKRIYKELCECNLKEQAQQ
ncbi:sentrin-specific protease 5-like isoform X1 [Syngnathus acus]|uniref:sentrin-specific protease 5-like isoform X1 n=1 Tax=Syngnathus acus TaxID=161584 RepID=UPI001886058B|nr:sentrin-specific protease 5-like isoform X1 [Syngnathus acus]